MVETHNYVDILKNLNTTSTLIAYKLSGKAQKESLNEIRWNARRIDRKLWQWIEENTTLQG